MRSFIYLGLLAGVGFIALGYTARSPGQAAISNTVIAVGILVFFVSAVGLALSILQGRPGNRD